MSSLPNSFADQLELLRKEGLYRTRVQVDSACKPLVHLAGRETLAFNSNDYLGLASDERVLAAYKEGVDLYGAGSGASHLISGHSQAHVLLEKRLAEFLSAHIPNVDALYLSSGYMANLAILTALADSNKDGTEIFSEVRNHASIIDATRLSRTTCHVYPHCDTSWLERLLSQSRASQKIVVTDSVFSMDGDIAPVKELVQLCERQGAWLVIDDAHGFGVLGEHGRGVLEEFGVCSSHVIYMGTLGKAAGVSGAFVCADKSFIDWMVQRSRPYIYTTAAPPANAHALLTSLEIIEGPVGFAKRAHLRALIQTFKARMSLAHTKDSNKIDQTLADNPSFALTLAPSSTHIQPLVIGSNEDVLKASKYLFERGVWVTAIRAPTVPKGTARLRITLSAAHSLEQLERLLNLLSELKTKPVDSFD